MEEVGPHFAALREKRQILHQYAAKLKEMGCNGLETLQFFLVYFTFARIRIRLKSGL